MGDFLSDFQYNHKCAALHAADPDNAEPIERAPDPWDSAWRRKIRQKNFRNTQR